MTPEDAPISAPQAVASASARRSRGQAPALVHIQNANLMRCKNVRFEAASHRFRVC